MNVRKFKIDNARAREFTWRALIFIIAVALLLIVITGWTRWQGAAGWQTTDDAYLQADLTPISARVAGYISDIQVDDFERVRGGQLVAH